MFGNINKLNEKIIREDKDNKKNDKKECEQITLKFLDRKECLELKHPLNEFSTLLKSLIYGLNDDDDDIDEDYQIPIPIEISNKTFILCKIYCELLANEMVKKDKNLSEGDVDEIRIPLENNDIKKIPNWKYDFITNSFKNLVNEKEELFKLLIASNYLGINSLLELCSATIAAIVPKTPEDFLNYFGIKPEPKGNLKVDEELANSLDMELLERLEDMGVDESKS